MDLESAHMLFDKDELDAIETNFLLDFGLGDLTITNCDIIAHHDAFLEIVHSPPSKCYRAHCEVHDHPRPLTSKFCTPHREAHIPATKLSRSTWWRRLWHERYFVRVGLVQ